MGLAACGGGGTTVAGGGSGGTGVGPVTGFGSVFVNGVEYSTGGANIVIGGVENRLESELKVGMRVRVDGGFSATGNAGTAERIEAIREVRGPLDDDGVDNVLNRLTVAGQTILVDPATLFDNVADLLALQSIQSGTLRHPEVEVHGASDDGGSIHATYIRKGADDFPVAADNVEVRGKISGLAPVLTRFFVNSLPVNYSGAVRVNVPLTGLADGMYVEVKGKITAAGGSGTLNAARVEVLDNTLGSSNDGVRVEGYVVSGTSKSSFVLLGPGGNVSVDGVSATLIPSTAAIAPGKKLQVEGAVAGAILKASVIRVRAANGVKMEGIGGQADLANRTFLLLSRTVQVDGYTRFDDDIGNTRNFNLTALFPTPSATDNVRVVGSWDGTRVEATLVERIVPGDPGLVLLQGPLDSGSIVPLASFNIIGVTVTSNSAFANTEFRDASGNPVSKNVFFANVLPSLGPNQVVKVKRGVFIPGSPSRVQDDSVTKKMEVEIEQINN
jgi:hypothetical protein